MGGKALRLKQRKHNPDGSGQLSESTATTSHSSSTRAKAETGQLPGRLHNPVSISTSKSPGLSPTSVKNQDFLIVFPESHVIVSTPSLLTKPLRTVKDLTVQSHSYQRSPSVSRMLAEDPGLPAQRQRTS